MEQPSDPNNEVSYIDGLKTADAQTLEQIYQDFRKETIQIISGMGGSEAAGSIFFQTALVEAGRQLDQNPTPENFKFGHYLQALAILHFKDWLEEREQAIPENYQEPEIDPSIRPTQENMRSTRADILSWRRPARSEELSFKSTTEKFRWQQMRAIERRIADGEPIQGRPRSKQPLWFIYTAIGVLLVVLAYIAFDFRSRAQAPQQVYESNFNPPNSIVNDLQRLQQADSSIQEGSSPCLERLKAADKPYQQQQFSAAAEILEEIADNESSADCQSDALFYLAIIALQRDQPTVTLQCLAKIDNIERYGEDLYWYQALAFVKIAAQNPDLREKAAGAVERARSNTSDPKRRNQAEKMLKELVEQ